MIKLGQPFDCLRWSNEQLASVGENHMKDLSVPSYASFQGGGRHQAVAAT
jgi:hypothetical protein